MPTIWGSRGGSLGVRIGLRYSDTEISGDGSQERIVGGQVMKDSSVSMTDTTNGLSGSGAAINDFTDSNVNFNGSGEKVLRSVTGQWRNRSYGNPTSADFTITATGLEGGGGTRTVTGSIPISARPYGTPAAPTGLTVTRVSDTQQNLAWTRNSISTAPYSNLFLERRPTGGSWAQIATLSGTAVAYSDKSTAADGDYEYRIRARTSTPRTGTGFSAYSNTVRIVTTPAAPTSATISKSGSNITVGWADRSAFETGFRIEESQTGPSGTFTLATTTAANVRSWIHTGASSAVTHTYRIAAVAGSLRSAWLTTTTVSLLTPPKAPLVTVPAVLDFDLTTLLIKVTHQPIDSTDQEQIEIRRRVVGSGVWTTWSGTLATSLSVPSGTYSNGDLVEVQARTKGDHADFGPWSASKLVLGSARPQLTITSPVDGGTVSSSQMLLRWTYVQSAGSPQAAWQAELYLGAWLAETKSGTGTVGQWKFTAQLVDGTGGHFVQVRAQSADGLWSDWTRADFSVEFVPPPAATGTAVFDRDEGSVELLVTVPPSGETEVDPISVDVYRGQVAIATGLPIPDDGPLSVVDAIPPLGQADLPYRVVVWSATPSSAETIIPADTRGSCWIFLHAGPGWATAAKVRANAQVGYTADRGKQLRTFYGGITKEFPAEATAQSWQVSGDVATWPDDEDRIGGRAPWQALASMPAPVCIRTPLGHRGFGSVSAIPQQSTAGSPHTGVSVTVTETSFDE